jgi:hypothetical protein
MEKSVVLRKHWKRLIFASIWPFALFAVGLLMGHSEHPRLIFFAIFFAVFLPVTTSHQSLCATDSSLFDKGSGGSA